MQIRSIQKWLETYERVSKHMKMIRSIRMQIQNIRK